MTSTGRPAYPEAPRVGLVETLPEADPTHRVSDPYRWLEDADDPRTQSWSEAQHALASEHLGVLPGREAFVDSLRRLLGAGVITAPAWRGERQFFLRRTAEQEHAVLLTVDPGGAERVLLDPMDLDPAGTTTLDTWQPSKEGHLLAYQVSAGGTEESVLTIMDVTTGATRDGPIDRARYSPVAWLPGGESFYYVRRLDPALVPEDEAQYHRRVYLHAVGADPSQDVEIIGAGLDMTNYYDASVSMDGRWLVLSASAGTAPRNDVWIADLAASAPSDPALVVVQAGVDAQASMHVGRDGRAYVLTDRDAPRGRLCVTDPATPAYEHWTDLVPEDPEAVLENYAILDGAELGDAPVLLCAWTRHAVSELSVHELASGRRTGTVPLPGLGSISGIHARPEGGHEAWFGYTDHVTVSAVHRYDAITGSTQLWASAPGSPPVPDIHTRQLTYTSYDGTPVRMFVLSGSERPGDPRPAILYGYGGFGVPLTPGFSATVLAWVEAGGVYAIANLRGGSEEGEEWHRAGMREHKQNVFDDFHAAAESLITEGWTTAAQLCASGGSNGGLLVGAALTQRPDLCAGIVCSAPLLDMVRYERFGLGVTWNDEYGTAADAVELGWLLSYSPYHRVMPGTAYPAVLFTVFEGDTRVDPLHARKLCAALQHATTSGRPVLLRAEKEVGHGARAISRTIDLSADVLAFAAAVTGLSVG